MYITKYLPLLYIFYLWPDEYFTTSYVHLVATIMIKARKYAEISIMMNKKKDFSGLRLFMPRIASAQENYQQKQRMSF